MVHMYTQTHTLTALHVNRFGRLKLSSLLYFAQTAAEGHCQDLSLGWEALHAQNLFWAVVRHKVQISRLPVIGETVTVKTWPMPTTRTAYPRACAGFDEKGNELFRCISLWVLMDCNTRAMVLPGKSGVQVEGLLTGNELAPPASLAPQPYTSQTMRRVSFSELDRNGHMNNTKYLDWVEDLLNSSFHQHHTPKELTICYLNEAKEGQNVALHYALQDGPCLRTEGTAVTEDSSDNSPRIFAAQVLF